MIDDKKLIAAFTYAAFDAGQCGNDRFEQRSVYMRSLLDFIKGNGEFPRRFFDEGNSKLASALKNGVRPYIYGGGHNHAILDSDDLEQAVATNFGYARAMDCAVNFYKVDSLEGDRLKGINLVTEKPRDLVILDGLEIPSKGDVVSGHFKHYLEVLPQNDDFEKYLSVSRWYSGELRRLHDTQK